MNTIISVSGLSKTYESGLQALKSVNLEVRRGELLALLGPNGAGKTTLINIICGLVTITSGSVTIDGFDVVRDYRKTRAAIGLVPQEMHLDPFESVRATVSYSRGLFGMRNDPALLERILKDLTLWDRRDAKTIELSGGMRRRVGIAKALIHEPRILFLDEPTAGVDVELRASMWELIRGLQRAGVTIILTTHYIDEAEEIADRVAVINGGEIILVEEKEALMRKLGRKRLNLDLHVPLDAVPGELARYDLALEADGHRLVYTYDTHAERTGITALLGDLAKAGIRFKDLDTKESSLEEIFVTLVRETA